MSSPVPLDKNLYNRVKTAADKRFQSKTGVYKSSWIVREYKRLGGMYTTKSTEKSGLKRWYKENWVDLNRPIKRDGKVIGYEPCGRRSILKNSGNKEEEKKNKKGKSDKYPLCRPTKRVTFRTPRLVSEITDESIKRAKREKQKIKSSGNIKFGGARLDNKQGKQTVSEETKQHLKQFLEKQKEKSKVDKQIKKDKKEKKRRVSKSIEEIFQDIEKGKIERMRGGPHRFERTYLQLSPEQIISERQFNETQTRIREMFPAKYQWMKATEGSQQKENTQNKNKQQLEGGKAQFYGKRSEKMVEVPKNVKRWAKYGYELKDLGFEGGIETGWRRAKQLSKESSIPIEDLRYMRNWYARHIFASYPSFKSWVDAGKPNKPEWHRKHGIISWVIWGGNAGFNWINSDKVIKLLNNHFNKNYKKIKKNNTKK